MGAVDMDPENIIIKMKQDNLTREEQQRIPFFYFTGGISYERMGCIPRLMLKGMRSHLKKKRNRTAEEEKMLACLEKSFDKTDRSYIAPLITCVRK